MHLNKLLSFGSKAALAHWMQPLVSCPSGLHRHMSVTMCPAAHQPRPLLSSQQMSPKEHDQTLIRRWQESWTHCHFLAPVSEEPQQQNPPVSPSLSMSRTDPATAFRCSQPPPGTLLCFISSLALFFPIMPVTKCM